MINSREHPKNLILASASPRRSELLRRIQLQFEVRPADVAEIEGHAEGPAQMVLVNAAMKAEKLSAEYQDSLVLGSDTTVAVEERIFGKPADLGEARAMLRKLSGRTHIVYTAVSLRWSVADFVEDFVESSRVTFRQLNDDAIDNYFAIVDPLDKAGAYGIQEGREMIIEAVEGSVANVMGLPVEELSSRLQANAFNFLER